MQSVKRFASRTAMAVALGASAFLISPTSASAADAHVQYWTYKCDYGRACVHHTDGNVWNIESCGVSGLNDRFNYAKAHGNPFTIWFDSPPGSTSSIYIPAWSERSIPTYRAYRVQVYC
ncbi:hypothetical protein RKD19_000075 [Streptomyces canus]